MKAIIFFMFSILAYSENLPKVTVKKLVNQDIKETFTYYGILKSADAVKYYSPVDGVVSKIHKRAGETANQNQFVLEIIRNEIDPGILPVKMRARTNGQIIATYVEENQFVTKNTLLFEIRKGNRYFININMTPSDAQKINLSDKVTVQIDEKEYEGKFISLGPKANLATGTKLAKIEVIASDLLSKNLGMLTKLNVVLGQEQGIILTKGAIKKKDGKDIIRILDKNETIKEQIVNLKPIGQDQYQVKSSEDLSDKSVVIKSSREPLESGEKVEVNNESNDA